MFTDVMPDFTVTDKRRTVWEVEMKMLDVIDEICKRNHISYFLFAGCLIGAVRHKGFIPWDEDMDIGMLREDFEKFLSVCKKEMDEKYAIQYGWNGQFDYPDVFFRMKDNNSTAILEWEVDKDMPKGVFIEIYPFDKVPQNSLLRKIHLNWCTLLWHFAKGSIERDGYTGLKRIMQKGLHLSKADTFWNLWLRACTKYNNGKSKLVNVVSIPRWAKTGEMLYFYEDIKECTMVDYEDRKYKIPVGVDRCLRISYGDYMKYPTKETINETKTRNTFYDPYLPYTEYENSETVREYFRRREGDCLN